MTNAQTCPAGNRCWQTREEPSRRDVLATLAAAAAGLALHARSGAAQPRRVIRTLTGDVDPGALSGSVLFHEHLSMRFPLGAAEHFTDDVALMTEEARAARADGVACLVDGGHADMGRSLDALRRITAESGLPVVASGGYYMQRSFPQSLASQSVEELADALAREAERERYGAFGEIGQQAGAMTPDEKKVFQAVAKVQARTGLPIFTHNAYLGTRPGADAIPRDTALRQLDVLEEAGAVAAHLAIGHVCCLDDPKAETAIALARRGAYVGFDRVTIQLIPDALKVTTIRSLLEAGLAERLLISSDFSSPRGLKKNGGGGLGQAVTVFAPLLREAGVGEAVLRQIFEENPKRFLAFTPKIKA
jgi:phosphotriesterase-related protein